MILLFCWALVATVACLALFARNRQLREFALTDSLTGLLNRRSFESLAAPIVKEVKTTREAQETKKGFRSRKSELMTFSVALFDLDRFKGINDTHGHAAGDDVIKAFASIACDHARGVDLIARWGGEEFVMLFVNATAEEVGYIAERIRATVEEKVVHWEDKRIRFTVSIGVAEFDPRIDLTEVLKRADTETYRAKENGRNRVEVQFPIRHVEQGDPVAHRTIRPA